MIASGVEKISRNVAWMSLEARQNVAAPIATLDYHSGTERGERAA